MLILKDSKLDEERIRIAIELACEPKVVINQHQEQLFKFLGQQLRSAEQNGEKREIRKISQILITFFQINNLRNANEVLAESTIETKLYNASQIEKEEDETEE